MTRDRRPAPMNHAAECRGRRRRAIAASVRATALLLMLTACKPSTWPDADALIPDAPDVIEAYGMTLDAQATPAQVTWVLLKAIAQDVQAPPRGDEQLEAIGLQCRLFNVELLRNPPEIQRRGLNPKVEVYERFLRYWAPAFAHYVDYLPEDFEQFDERANARPAVDGNGNELFLVSYGISSGDHGGPAGLDVGATMRCKLFKTKQGYWRVGTIGFDRSPDLPE